MPLIPLPLFIKFHRKAKDPEEARRLVVRLLKFCDTQTPKDYEAHGEKWGEGQIHITGRDGRIYRGQIAPPSVERAKFPWTYNPHDKKPAPIPPELLPLLPLKYPTLPDGSPRPTIDGLSVCVQCAWIAQKGTGIVIDQWEIKTPTWHWELIPCSSFLGLPIQTFYQNKASRKDGVFHPKRLFFDTDRGEPGYFAQRHDTENIRCEDGVFTDPLRPFE